MGIIGSLFSGIFGGSQANKAATVEANASTHAADLEKQAADQSLAFQKQQYGNSLSLLSPFYNTGTAANSRLAYLMGLNPAQGLPSGVINPNAPPSATTFNGGTIDPNALNNLRALRGIPGNVPRLNLDSALSVPQFGPGTNNGTTLPTGNPGTPPFTMNPPITSGGTSGMTGGGTDTNPFPNGLGNLGVTNASGAPGTVARTDGSFNMNPPITSPTLNPNDPNQGFSPNSVAASGGFGSLAQGWGQTFQSPTAVTEQNDPGYQFRLAQGQKALEASAAARGGLLTGGTSKAINDYAQNSASNEYGNVYNRALQNYQTNYNTFSNDQANLFNRLSALSGTGQISANQLSGAGQNFANSSGNLLMGSAGQQGVDLQNAANARGSGYINQANAYGNMANNLGGALSLFQLLGGGA